MLKRLRTLPKVLRLAAFLSCVCALVLAASARAVAQNAREGLLAFGHEMMRYAGNGSMGAERRLSVNGAEVRFATGSSEDSVRAVLEYYEARCAEHDGGLAAQVEELQAGTRAAVAGALAGRAQRGRRSPATLRGGGENQGFVACLDARGARFTVDELTRRLRRFGETGDVSDVGHLRYLYAERAENGRTRFIGFWSEGRLAVREMFPTTGDAPGGEIEGVVRAPGLRRLLLAREEGEPYGVAIYAGATDREQAERHYREAMTRDGWTLLPLRGGAPDLQGQTMLAFERDRRTVHLVLDTTSAGQTSVTVLAAH